MQRLVQALLDRPDDEAPDDGGVAKAHLGLGRMDVDVDLARFALDEQGGDRMPVGGEEIEIGPAQRAGERLVAHRPPVDEQELLGSVRPAEGRQAHPAGKPRAVASRVEPNRIQAEIVAEGLAQPLSEARFALASGRPVERRADVGCERKARLRRGHRQPFTASAAASASARSDLRNLSRAGVAAKRSRASTRAPTGEAEGSIALFRPSSTTSLSPVGAPAAVRI